MIPAVCTVKHNPPHTYGDCVRAAVASVLNLSTTHVPHFYHDGCSGDVGASRLRDYLRTVGYFPCWITLDGSASVQDVLTYMGAQNPGFHYLFFGSTSQGPHVVVCMGDTVVHDPSWYRQGLIAPTDGVWQIVVLVAGAMAGDET